MWKHYLEERETERLFIRPLVPADHIDWSEFIMDEVATRYFPDDWKLKPEKSEEWITRQLLRYKEDRYSLQALIEKESGKLVGLCGLISQTVDGEDELEIGYHLIRRYWDLWSLLRITGGIPMTIKFRNTSSDTGKGQWI